MLSASVVSPSVPAQSATTFVQTQPWYALAIVPATGSQSVGMGSNGSYSAQMKNISWNTASPITATLLSTGCKNSVLASCTIASTPLSVAQGITSGSTTLKYAAVGQGTETVGLSATGVASGGPVNPGSGSVAVTVTAGPLSIATRGVSPGMTLDRGDCVAIAAGEGAAMECGDLRVVHALPTNVTMNKLRTPLLLYNSRFANSGVVVQANVYYSGAQVPDTLEVTATLRGSVTMRKYRWGGGVSTCTGFNCRIAIVVPAAAADSTGVYAYTLVAVAKQAGAVLYTSPTITDTLVMVNRSVSTFGQGWWLDGLETVMQLSDPTLVLWIGGDGSSRVYRRAATDTFVVNPAYERRDTLFRVGTNWKRSVGNGAAVWFNNAGKHDSTVSILGHVTRFVYAVVGGKTVLKQLKFPVVDSVNAPRNYTFEYNATATALDSVVTSSQNNAPRAVKATSSSGSILALRDPDMRSVAFAYSNARMVTRTNKLADVDTFTYDNAGALRRSARNMTRTDPNAQPIAVTIRAAETVGATAANDAPRRLTTVSTYIDGPLPISDTTWFFVGPYGVSRIINAMGQATVLDREDARFPALITRKTLPNAFVQQAWYSARALLDSTKDINPLRDGRDARTLYTWHPIWDKVASITAPTGELTTYGYSAARATRITEDIGPDTTRRVRYSYVPSTQLLQSVKVPLSTQPSTLLYDATLGNLSTVTSAMGFETRYSRASTGLDSLIQTQVDNTKTKWLDVFTYLDRMGRDSVIVTNGPAVATSLGTVIAKSTRVDTKYDAGGNAIAVSRSQTPDLSPEPIGTLTSHVGYDPAGRVIADTAADGNAQRHWYDVAGNDTLTLTRRGDSIFTSYDAVNRVLTRRIPSARDTAADDLGIATISLLNFGRRAYPWFPTNADGSYVIAADTARFEYDALGNVTRADNADALVRRTYFPNGVLESEAQVIATWAQRDTTIHRYTINYSYDLSNRRLTTVHPQALAPSTTQNVASYSYNALGQLGTVTDILGNSFTLQYDLRGDRVGTRMPGNIRDTLTLDDDERTSRFQVFSNTQAIRDNMLSRDPGGRVLMSRSPAVTDSMVAEYSGLGHMVRRYWARLGVGTLSGVYAVLDADETFTLDAFADRLTSVKNSRVFKYTGNPWTEGEGTNVRYYGGTGRLRATDYMINGTAINHTDTLVYDAGGNLKLSVAKTWQLGPTEHPGLSDRAMYYGADGRLRASESRTHVVENTSNPPSQWQVYFEEYRYDAFGRRVAIRKRSSCSTANSDTPRTCSLGFMRRTVWDGNAELYEIQMPDDALAEEDTVHVARLHMYTQSGISADINPQYGRVAYAYELSVDRPVSLTRINYVDSVLNHSGYAYYPSFTVVPHWDWRDHADTGTTASGQSNYCLPSDPTRCVGVTWRRQAFAFAMEPADTLAGWYGTLIYDKEDGTGTMYRRNRYVDPASGRFTQEDPIGLAGGMNLYGFANGDPINFADPFGLDAIYVRYNLYPINVGGAHIPLWHSAVIAVDKNGHTRYYEYGRYDSEHKGEVRRRSVPDLVMGKDGKPTQESLNRLYDYVSKNYGHGKGVHAEYDAEADYQSVVDFAEQRKNDPNRKDYNLLTNSCTTFAHDAVDAGKKKPEEKKP
ncbi:MAG TPA: RHS repeat-associated core domain-containing protein [Gemmatimonadaceae bacterium]|nr:RHS repeat-associated core domain-containing protein [Gemmatimonadaceae bacterium]